MHTYIPTGVPRSSRPVLKRKGVCGAEVESEQRALDGVTQMQISSQSLTDAT